MKILYDYQLPVIACFLLFFAMILYWISLSIPKNDLIFQVSKALVGVSNVLFVLTLSIRWVSEGYFPLSNLYESLIFLSWGISFIHLIVEYKTQSRLIGAIATPLMFFLSGFSSLTLPTDMQKALPLVPSLQSNWLMMHVSMMMVSYATLILGSLLSILYLAFLSFSGQRNKHQKIALESSKSRFYDADSVLEGSIRSVLEGQGEQKKEREVSVSSMAYSKLSLLQTVDIWSYRIIGLGFPFLTIGIISGAVWANEAWGSYWSWDPKETWALKKCGKFAASLILSYSLTVGNIIAPGRAHISPSYP